jgi:hypothetical protein
MAMKLPVVASLGEDLPCYVGSTREPLIGTYAHLGVSEPPLSGPMAVPFTNPESTAGGEHREAIAAASDSYPGREVPTTSTRW